MTDDEHRGHTEEEETEVVEHELGERLATCARCGRERPDIATGGPASGGYGNPESDGWFILEDGIVCEACATAEEMDNS